jgi:hypothetical protein
LLEYGQSGANLMTEALATTRQSFKFKTMGVEGLTGTGAYMRGKPKHLFPPETLNKESKHEKRSSIENYSPTFL